MPQTMEEGNKNSHTSDSPANIVVWWHKFHFSGRVIMCSVLFGLGLILIGGLIFAIYTDDDSKDKPKDSEEQMPAKVPYNYVGPVVMGIGGFIVIVGVIMCLFETQVCRKKTGDSSPLISGKTEDPEGKFSDPKAVPSTSHGNKNHKHKSRKTSASPRKSKGRHAKSHSHDQQKNSSSKSPPLPIDKSKGFMTSSEDKFLTPPNTLDEHTALVNKNSRDAESQASESLMKSFTSSGPSWNQSSEFLTPSTSFRDTSVSLENSVEIDEKQGQVNFKTTELPEKDYTSPEYMSPLPVEEDRIQKLFIRVKNEQQEKAKREMDEKVCAVDINAEYENDKDSSQMLTKSVEENIEVCKDAENIGISANELPSAAVPNTLASKDTAGQKEELDTHELEEKKNINEENYVSDEFSSKSNVHVESPIAVNNDEVGSGLSDISTRTEEKETPSEQGSEKEEIPSSHDSPTLSTNEVKPDLDLDPGTEAPNNKINANDTQADLESSVSSVETVVSRDGSIEKPDESVENRKSAMEKENSSIETKALNISESPEDVNSATGDSSSNHQNTPSDIVKEEAGVNDLIHSENDKKEDKSVENVTEGNSS